MNSNKAEVLIENYWAGETNLQEEEALKAFFASEGLSHKDAAYFNYLQRKSMDDPLDKSFDEAILNKINQNSSASRLKVNSFSYWLVAASLALILSIGVILKNEIFKTETPPPIIVQADTFDDPEKAFEETKKALLFLSSKLNESSEYTNQLSKFDESQEILKKNQK